MAQPTLDDVLINDFYWLARARAMVDSAITSREEAATKLVTGVGWFWTVYSTVAIVGTAIAEADFAWWVAITLALPALFLMAAYLLGLLVMIPFDGRFDPRSPTEIEQAYRAAVELKRRRLRIAVIALIVAAVSVVAAVLAAAVTSPKAAS